MAHRAVAGANNAPHAVPQPEREPVAAGVH
jgi:hypothetical protein